MVEPGTVIVICIGIGAMLSTAIAVTGILLAPMVPSSDKNNEPYKKHVRNSVPSPYMFRGYHGPSAAFLRV